eukprot:m.139280 g.139280  ORF g.139280 m.139280 type:complete len:100 (+) comp17616_c0_seq1:253-552(+)
MAPTQLSLNDCRSILTEVVSFMDDKANIDKAKDATGNDMAQMMISITRTATELLIAKITPFGYAPSQKGAMAFLAATNEHAHDPTVQAARQKILALVAP